LVAGIAHEINTPLAYVRGTLDLTLEKLPTIDAILKKCIALASFSVQAESNPQETRRLAQNLLPELEAAMAPSISEELGIFLNDGTQGIDQIQEIVINLKDFSRIDSALVNQVDIRQCIESTLLIAKNMLKNKVRIIKRFDSIPLITCSPSQINQVLLNLISNAVHAIADQGTITISTKQLNAQMIEIQVEDDGSGISPEHLPLIFDPFFTTKKIGEGTGLGLSISYKIIEHHGGRINVTSDLMKGTCFTISLPIVPVARPERAITMPQARPMMQAA
jgi:two-component system NtrC family sensor kinase